MNDKDRFFSLIQLVKGKLNRVRMIKAFQQYLLELSFAQFFWIFLSYFIVIPYVERYILLTIFVLLIFQLIRFWKGRIRTEEAVKFANRFVKEDRVLSAYRFIDKSGPVETLLVQDAVKHLEKDRDQIMNDKLKKIYPTFLLFSVILLLCTTLLSLYPNEVMREAKKQEIKREVVQELREKIQEQKDEETDEDVKKLQEQLLQMMDDTNDPNELLEKFDQMVKENELSKRKEGEKAQNYQKWLEDLRKNGLSSLADSVESEDVEAMKNALTQLEKQWEQLDENSKRALKSAINSESSTENWMDELEKKIEEWKLAERTIELNEKKGEYVSRIRDQFVQQLTSFDLVASNVQSHSNSTTDQGSSTGNDKSVQGDGNYKGDQTSQSNETNNEGTQGQTGPSENASHSSQGQQNGGTNGVSNSDATQGEGRGKGNRQEDRNDQMLLTVPEKLDGPINIEEDFGAIGEGRQGEEFESGGLAIKGTLRPYEELFSEYEKAYLESTNRTNLPEQLQKIIQNYFSSIKP